MKFDKLLIILTTTLCLFVNQSKSQTACSMRGDNSYPIKIYHYMDSYVVFDIFIDSVSKGQFKLTMKLNNLRPDLDTVYYYNLKNWTAKRRGNDIDLAIADDEGDFHFSPQELLPLSGKDPVTKSFTFDHFKCDLVHLRFSYFLNVSVMPLVQKKTDSLGIKHYFIDSGFPLAGKYFSLDMKINW